jgi:hypothetical protein
MEIIKNKTMNANAVELSKEPKKWEWSRYRKRLSKHFSDVSRDYKKKIKICFEHRCLQSKCHCKNEIHHKLVTEKIRIPKMTDNKEWERLKIFVLSGFDCPEVKFIIE